MGAYGSPDLTPKNDSYFKNMQKCRKCGNYYHGSMKKCPHCGASRRSPAITIFLITVVILIAGCKLLNVTSDQKLERLIICFAF